MEVYCIKYELNTNVFLEYLTINFHTPTNLNNELLAITDFEHSFRDSIYMKFENVIK